LRTQGVQMRDYHTIIEIGCMLQPDYFCMEVLLDKAWY
jgi:hypothetical protein